MRRRSFAAVCVLSASCASGSPPVAVTAVSSSFQAGTSFSDDGTTGLHTGPDATLCVVSVVDHESGICATIPDDGRGAVADHPSWTPDGSQVFFHRGSPFDAGVYAFDVAAQAIEPVGPNGDNLISYQPAVSPDGSRVAYLMFSHTTEETVAVISYLDRDATSRVPLTGSGAMTGVQWANEEALIVFGEDVIYRIETTGAATPTVTPLTTPTNNGMVVPVALVEVNGDGTVALVQVFWGSAVRSMMNTPTYALVDLDTGTSSVLRPHQPAGAPRYAAMAFATFDGADHVIFTVEDLTADLVDVGSGEPEPPVHLVRSTVAGILSGELDEEVIADNLASLVAESLFAVYWSPLDGYGVSVAVDGTFTFAVTSASNARENGVVSVSTGR